MIFVIKIIRNNDPSLKLILSAVIASNMKNLDDRKTGQT